MEINTTNQVQGLETATKISDVKREKEDAPGRQAAQTGENPDYRISLSDASKKAVSELNSAQAPGQGTENDEPFRGRRCPGGPADRRVVIPNQRFHFQSRDAESG